MSIYRDAISEALGMTPLPEHVIKEIIEEPIPEDCQLSNWYFDRTGIPHSKEVKKRISDSSKGLHSGKNNGMYGKGHLVSGKKNPMYGKTISEAGKKKISDTHKKRTGEKNHFYGMSHSQETKKYMSEYRKANPTHVNVVCPHCNKKGAKNVMVRWHFDNCKEKLNVE